MSRAPLAPSRVWASFWAGDDPEREARVHELGREVASRVHPALEDHAEADLLGVGDALVEVGEGSPVVEVGKVHDVALCAEVVGEGVAAGREAEGVVEQQHVGHERHRRARA